MDIGQNKVKEELIKVYKIFIESPQDKKTLEKAETIHKEYYPLANILFDDVTSKAIWGTIDIYTGDMSKEKAKEILRGLESDWFYR